MGSLYDDVMEEHAKKMRHSIHCSGYRGRKPFNEENVTV
jgi:hypothetical protein